jgi:chaperonin GroEL
MAKKIIKFGTQARKAIQRGVNIVVDAVQTSYGPAGRNSVIEKSYGSPEITNDGVTIAKAIELEGFEALGAKLIVEAANKTNDKAGDGTSVTSILSGALINEGIKVVEAGSDPVKVKKGMQKAADFALNYLNKEAKQIKTVEEMADVATISSRSSEIGKMIAELIDKVGKDGVVTVSDGESNQIETDLTEGMQFDKGYKSPYFVTDNEKMEAVVNKTQLLVTDQKVSSIQDILPLIEGLSQAGKKELVIIADDIESEALATFIVNKIRGIFSIFAVQAPAFGDRRKAMLEDIAVLTGATYISSDLGMTLKQATTADLGNADKVVITKDTTTIVSGKGDKDVIKHRIESLKKAVLDTKSDYDKEKLQERVAKLTGGVAVIKVGAATEVQMKELKFQVEDAVNATKAAVAEGVVPGGASTLIRIAKQLESIEKADTDDEAVGVSLFRRALLAPFRAIAKNSGIYDISILVNQIETSKTGGYDFAKLIMQDDMIKSGIIDPVLVLKQAIANSTSIASSLITTEVAMVEEKEKKDLSQASQGMGGMDDMGF